MATAAAAPARVIGVAARTADQQLAARRGFDCFGAGIAIKDWTHVTGVTDRAVGARMVRRTGCGHRGSYREDADRLHEVTLYCPFPDPERRRYPCVQTILLTFYSI